MIEKEFISDSGGAGASRGGLGQKVILESVSNYPTREFLLTDRIHNPARGYDGGADGQVGAIYLNDVAIDEPKGEVVLHRGDRITLLLPGGGGYGSPQQRSADKITMDLENELVSPTAARADYDFEVKMDCN